MKKIFGMKMLKLKNATLIKNFSYLTILQIFNMLIPLITYPYLVNVLGKEKFGIVVFAQAIVSYFVIIIGFGFNISATKEISKNRGNKNKLSEIVSSIFIIKSILFLLCFFLFISLLFLLPESKGYESLFLFSLWACFYDVIFPIWYFEGIEQMKYITFITLISKFIFLGLIFVLIHKTDDFLYVPIIYGLGALVSGLISLIIIFKNHKIRFKWQPFQILKNYLNASIPIFICNVSTVLYVNTNKVFVGSFLGMTEVAYYDLAERIITILKIPLNTLSQSLFPKVSKEKNIDFVIKIFWASLLFNTFLYLFILIFAKYIIIILGGKQMIPANTIVKILTLTLPFVSISGILGLQLLIPFGYENDVSKVVLLSGLFYITLVIILYYSNCFSILNITLTSVITELFVSIFMFYFCLKHNLWKKIKFYN